MASTPIASNFTTASDYQKALIASGWNASAAAEQAQGVFGSGTSTATQPPQTQAQVDAAYSAAVGAHPAFAGNSAQAIAYASSTGDLSGLLNSQGQPFSTADQQAAVSQATAANAPYYQAEQTKDTADAASSMGSDQASYNKYLADQATAFQNDKTTQDQTAANNGVLFSGGRAQKLSQLASTYGNNAAYQQGQTATSIGNTARSLGYKYGDTAASGLSQYYNLGGQTYNPNVATGGVGSSGLSSIYNANQGFQGTEINAAKTAAQTAAAALLANKANKLTATGYQNQF